MAKKIIDLGTVDDANTGDSLYEGGGKINDNFTEVYDAVTLNTAKKTSKFIDGTDPLDAVYMDGNVGIGTEAPSEKLEVDGNAKADSFLIDGGKAIKTDVVGEPTGSDQVVNVVSLTQAEYDASTPIATTFYIITE